MTQTLLDITNDMRALDGLLAEVGSMLEASEGEVTPEIQAVLDAVDAWKAELDRDLDGKVDGYATFIKELEGRAQVRKQRADELAARARIDTRNADWLKGVLLGELQRREVKKLETHHHRVSVAANGGKLPLLVKDETALLAEERFVIVKRELNKDAVREALDAGEELNGAVYGERGSHLSLR